MLKIEQLNSIVSGYFRVFHKEFRSKSKGSFSFQEIEGFLNIIYDFIKHNKPDFFQDFGSSQQLEASKISSPPTSSLSLVAPKRAIDGLGS